MTGIESNEEKCQKVWKSYHSNFPDVASLTSAEYLTNIQSSEKKYVLVDVRTKAEQNVSMIPNAVSLRAFESTMKSSSSNNATNDDIVVTYCTVGYRSGLEARRLRDKYNLKKVMNLDGIVSYTHACSAIQNQNRASEERNIDIAGSKPNISGESVSLIDPKTKAGTKRVHVFGPTWNVVSKESEAIYFSNFTMALRGFGVVIFAFVQKVKGFLCRPCLKSDATSTT
jgi:rhodanese-related sulfurtransferase